MGRGTEDYGTKGRRTTCAHCGATVTVRPREVWECKHVSGSIRIVSAERDGAIVEQVGRETIEPRWGISYRDLLNEYSRG